MNEGQKRLGTGLATAFVVHLLAALVLGIYALHFANTEPEIIEVTLAGGSSGSVAQTEAVQTQTVVEKSTDDIIDRKKKEKKPEEKKVVKKEPVQKPNPNPNPNSNNSNVNSDAPGKGKGTGVGDHEGPGSGKGSPITLPRLLRAYEPPYPMSARRASIEGTVYVKMLVSDKGNVEQARLAKSSGNTALDEAAVKAAYKWKFSAARDKMKRKVSCYITIPIKFQLKK